jgi:hypothetical protein
MGYDCDNHEPMSVLFTGEILIHLCTVDEDTLVFQQSTDFVDNREQIGLNVWCRCLALFDPNWKNWFRTSLECL